VNSATTGFTADEAKRVGEQIGMFRIGMEVELEHGSRDPRTSVTDDDPLVTGKIALAHLDEFADYYTRLERMEEEAKRDHGNGGTPPGRSGHS
jgi:Protein of unknown function (DUF5661)